MGHIEYLTNALQSDSIKIAASAVVVTYSVWALVMDLGYFIHQYLYDLWFYNTEAVYATSPWMWVVDSAFWIFVFYLAISWSPITNRGEAE